MKIEEIHFCVRCGTPIEDQLVPVTCPNKSCGYQFWLNPTPIVAVVCETPDGVILAHNKTWPAGIIAPISGFVDYREDPKEAAKRETLEELGLWVEDLELLGVYNFPAMNQTIIAYHAKVSGTVVLGDELDEYRIIALDKLKAWNFGTGLAVADFLKKARKE